MTDLTQLTPAEVRAMPKEAIIQAIFKGETYPIVNLDKDEFGNSTELTEETYRKWDDALVGTKIVTWDYYDAKVGNVRDILAEELYEEGSLKAVLVTRQDMDGKEQPVVIARQVFAKPIAEPIEELIGK